MAEQIWVVLVLNGASMRMRAHKTPLQAHEHAEHERERGRVVRVMRGCVNDESYGHGINMHDVTSETSLEREGKTLQAKKGQG